MNGLDFLTSQTGDPLHPQFSRVLKGFDSEEVETYVNQMAGRIATLEASLQEARDQRDAAQRRYNSAKEESFRQAASRMGEVVAAADRAAGNLRHEAEDEASRLLGEAKQQADKLRREAEDEACRLRQEGESSLLAARAEVDRVLGELAARREEVLAEFSSIRSRVLGIVEDLDGAASASAAVEVPDPPAPEPSDQDAQPTNTNSTDPTTSLEPTAATSGDSERDELLDSAEGFDLFIPDLLSDEGP